VGSLGRAVSFFPGTGGNAPLRRMPGLRRTACA
jgi:hypothetical protein